MKIDMDLFPIVLKTLEIQYFCCQVNAVERKKTLDEVILNLYKVIGRDWEKEKRIKERGDDQNWK